MKLVFQAPRQEKLATTVHSNGQVCHNGQCYDRVTVNKLCKEPDGITLELERAS